MGLLSCWLGWLEFELVKNKSFFELLAGVDFAHWVAHLAGLWGGLGWLALEGLRWIELLAGGFKGWC